ncbi:hypothetical protein C1H46_002176 [Malus baccata]|uniref:Uncharacterized protein n=1 Tax=Malus baccata TaxID=106549 RepID=A0A540NMI2_MALBA|nr:hypothetical protein C1H46_002176 [Malus baccata]
MRLTFIRRERALETRARNWVASDLCARYFDQKSMVVAWSAPYGNAGCGAGGLGFGCEEVGGFRVQRGSHGCGWGSESKELESEAVKIALD